MKNEVERLLGALGLETTAFPSNSRYHGLPVQQRTGPNGEPQVYVKRRLIPRPETYATLQWHTVVHGDRLDNLSFRYLGDPQVYWQICDANVALQPEDLTAEVGRRLRITLPAGIPGEDDV